MAATHVGARGTTVWSGTGWSAAAIANRSQSWSTALVRAVIVTLLVIVDVRACCSMLKRCVAPYKAGVVLRKVPSRRLNFRFEVHFCCKKCFIVSVRLVSRWLGNCIVMADVLMSHPSIRFVVEKVVSP